MFSAFAGFTSMSGSLLGNGSSQSSFVFAPPLVTVHSNWEWGPCCFSKPNASKVTVRFFAIPDSGKGGRAPAGTINAANRINAMIKANVVLSFIGFLLKLRKLNNLWQYCSREITRLGLLYDVTSFTKSNS